MNFVHHYILGKLVLNDGLISLLPDIAYVTFGFETELIPESDKRVRAHRWLHSPLVPLVLFLINKRLAKAWALHLIIDAATHDRWRPFYPLAYTIKRRLLDVD